MEKLGISGPANESGTTRYCEGTLSTLRTRRNLTRAALVTLLLGSTYLTPGIVPRAFGLPQNGNVTQGQVDISLPDPQTMMLQQGTTSAIIDWESFDLDPQDRFLVFQPTDDSWLLNRVNGGTVSTILGEIQANGGLVLVNPNGITLGNGSRINAGSLIMTTTDISDENFINRNFVFDRPGSPLARIWNKGELRARAGGLVALVAPGVENDGTITANLGQIAIGAGRTFTLDLYGDNLIRFGVSDALINEVTGDLIRNSGTLRATGGRILLDTSGAARAVDGVLNMDGYIEANSAVEENGEIVLFGGEGTVLVSGTVQARGDNAGETGGDIDIRGRHTGLMDGGTVDASGHSGGGRVAFGGDYQGGRAPAPDGFMSAKQFQGDATYVAPTARINVRANHNGDGGIATVWADKVTRFLGTIDGRGGELGGNGGFAEVSGFEQLIFEGTAMMRAIANGTHGTLLLDPSSITISSGADSNISITGDVFESSGGGISNIAISTLAMQMDSSTNVIITTGTATAGSISFNSAFTHTSNNSNLTLSAATGSVDIFADINIGGNFIVNAGTSISQYSASVTANDVAYNGTLIDFHGTSAITASGDNITLNAGSIVNPINLNNSALTLNAANTVALNGRLLVPASPSSLTVTAPNMSVNGGISAASNTIDLSAVTTATFDDDNLYQFGTFLGPTNLVLTQTVTTLSSDAAMTLGSVTGTGTESVNIYTGFTNLTVGSLGTGGNQLNDVFIQSVAALTINTAINTLGGFNVTSTASADISGTAVVGGATNISASSVSIGGTFTGSDAIFISAPTAFVNNGTITAQDRPASMAGGSIDITTDDFTNTSGLLVAEDYTGSMSFNQRGRVSIQTHSTPFVVGSGGTLTGADITDGTRIDAHELTLRTFNGDLTVNDAITHEGFLALSASGNFNINATVTATEDTALEQGGVVQFDAVNSTSSSTLDVGSSQLLSSAIGMVNAEEISFIADDGVQLNTPISGFERLFIQADKDFDGTGTLFLNAAVTLDDETFTDTDVNGNSVTVNEGGFARFEAATFSIGAFTIDVSPDVAGVSANEYRYGSTDIFFTNTNNVVIDSGGDLTAAQLGSLGERVRIHATDDITFNVSVTNQQIELVADSGSFGTQEDGTGDVILSSGASITNSSFSVSGQAFDRSIAFVGNDFTFNATASAISSQNIRIAYYGTNFTVGSGGVLDGTELQQLTGDSLYMINADTAAGFESGCDFPHPTEAECFSGTLTLDGIAAADFGGISKSLFFGADNIVVGSSGMILPSLSGTDPFLFNHNVLFSATDNITVNSGGFVDASSGSVPSVKFLADADTDMTGDITINSTGGFTGIDVTFDGYNVFLNGSVTANDSFIFADANATANNLSVGSLTLDSAIASLNGSVNSQTASAAAIEVSFTGTPVAGQHLMNGTLIPSAQPSPAPGPAPTPAPTPSPTLEPTPQPTPAPTPQPTPAPTPQPTPAPTLQPTPLPTPAPSPQPTPVDVITNPDGTLDRGAGVDPTVPLDADTGNAIVDEAQRETGGNSDRINLDTVNSVIGALGPSTSGSVTVDLIIRTLGRIDQTLEQTEDTTDNLDNSDENEEEEEKEEELRNAVQINTGEGQFGNVEVFDPADSGSAFDPDDDEGFGSGAPCQC